MVENLPSLSFLPVAQLLIHEWHDEQRTPPLIERMQSSGVFRNPPIVTPLQDGSDRFMVLDGANRITALRKMAYPHALVQIVQPDDPGLSLQNWNHVVWGVEQVDFLAGMQSIPETKLEACLGMDLQPDLWGECGLALVKTPNGELFTLCSTAEALVIRIHQLNAMVNSYKDRAQLDRTSARDIDPYLLIHPDLSGLVIFPHFSIQHVLQLASAGFLLPAGITRFAISPRALHVNYPLEALAAEKSIAEKNQELQRWIQERIVQKGVRYYAEATFLFDE